MAEHNEVGGKGELLAGNYLMKKGYEILATNWRWRKSELDIVARDGAWLVFVEVKTRQAGSPADPEEAITLRKQKQLILGANGYIATTGIDLECRFDVISVILHEASARINHFTHAFRPLP